MWGSNLWAYNLMNDSEVFHHRLRWEFNFPCLTNWMRRKIWHISLGCFLWRLRKITPSSSGPRRHRQLHGLDLLAMAVSSSGAGFGQRPRGLAEESPDFSGNFCSRRGAWRLSPIIGCVQWLSAQAAFSLFGGRCSSVTVRNQSH